MLTTFLVQSWPFGMMAPFLAGAAPVVVEAPKEEKTDKKEKKTEGKEGLTEDELAKKLENERKPLSLEEACKILIDTRMNITHPPPPPPPPQPKKYSCFIGAVEDTGDDTDIHKVVDQIAGLYGDTPSMVAGFRATLPVGYDFALTEDQRLVLEGPGSKKPKPKKEPPPPPPKPPEPPKPQGLSIELALVHLNKLKKA